MQYREGDDELRLLPTTGLEMSMPDADPEHGSNELAATAPPSVKRVLVWLGICTTVLAALALTFESAERLAKDAESLWHMLVGSPTDTNAMTNPAPHPSPKGPSGETSLPLNDPAFSSFPPPLIELLEMQGFHDAILSNLNGSLAAVDINIRVPLNDNQKSALAAMSYNLGGGTVKGAKVFDHINNGDLSSLLNDCITASQSIHSPEEWTKTQCKQEVDLFNKGLH